MNHGSSRTPYVLNGRFCVCMSPIETSGVFLSLLSLQDLQEDLAPDLLLILLLGWCSCSCCVCSSLLLLWLLRLICSCSCPCSCSLFHLFLACQKPLVRRPSRLSPLLPGIEHLELSGSTLALSVGHVCMAISGTKSSKTQTLNPRP